jgi:hypothetical protein
MDAKLKLQIAADSFKSAQDVVKAQIAAGKPNHGLPGIRHIAVLADVTVEVLQSHVPELDISGEVETKIREVLRAAFSGSMLNASALRQRLEGSKGKDEAILVVDTDALENQY